jgi:hypothetical protein
MYQNTNIINHDYNLLKLPLHKGTVSFFSKIRKPPVLRGDFFFLVIGHIGILF